jgi:large subunit ribosomal protein L17
VTTTLAKAKAARSVAEKMVTLGKKGTHPPSPAGGGPIAPGSCAAKILFKEIAPAFKDRRSGYTRIVKHHRKPARSQGDAAQRAILEWVDCGHPGGYARRRQPPPRRLRRRPRNETGGRHFAETQDGSRGRKQNRKKSKYGYSIITKARSRFERAFLLPETVAYRK